jgi:hypothetical protein
MLVHESPVLSEVTTLYPLLNPPKHAQTVDDAFGLTATSVILTQFEDEGNPVLLDFMVQVSPMSLEKYNAPDPLVKFEPPAA